MISLTVLNTFLGAYPSSYINVIKKFNLVKKMNQKLQGGFVFSWVYSTCSLKTFAYC